MKNTRWMKFMALLLAMLMLLPMAIACKNEEPIATETEETTESETTIEDIKFIEDGKSEYAVVRPSRATEAEIAAAGVLRDAINAKCGIKLKLLNELDIKNEKAICVGKVNRDSVKKLTEEIDYLDYVIGVSGTDVVICGGNDEKTAEAVERFISEYLPDKTKNITLAGDLKILSFAPNKQTVKVGDLRLNDYSIIVPSSALSSSYLDEKIKSVNSYFIENYGFGFEIKNSTTAPTSKEIIIGDTTRVKPAALQAELTDCGLDYGTIYFDDGNIWITGNAVYTVTNAFEVFIEDYVEKIAKDGDTLKLPTNSKRVNCSGNEYLVMSYNVLYSSSVADGYPEMDVRMSALINRVTSINPDVLGVQECSEIWYTTLMTRLVTNGNYGVVGEMNDPDGQKWRNPIYYNKNKFDLLDSGTKWLSNTPDVKSRLTNPPEDDSNGCQYRILSYVVLRDKITGEVFAHTNTHLGFGVNDRPAQDEIVLTLSSAIGKEWSCPVIITGDFNTGDYISPSGKKTREEFYNHYEKHGFMDSAKMTNINKGANSVDIVFAAFDGINVVSHDILDASQNGLKLSDHRPTLSRIRLKKAN